MKVAIVTGIWGRHDVFRMYANGINKLIESFPEVKFIPIVVGSEGQESANLVHYYGFEYIEYPNQPLAMKMQATIDTAMLFEPDYVLCMGSDDVIHPDLFAEYLSCMENGTDYIGCLDFYFLDLVSDKALYWGGYREEYRKGILCGAGRCLSNRLIKELGGVVWNSHNNMLDTSMERRLSEIEYTSAKINIRESGLYGLDLKSETNMTPFAQWDNTEFIDAEELKEKFDYIW